MLKNSYKGYTETGSWRVNGNTELQDFLNYLFGNIKTWLDRTKNYTVDKEKYKLKENGKREVLIEFLRNYGTHLTDLKNIFNASNNKIIKILNNLKKLPLNKTKKQNYINKFIKYSKQYNLQSAKNPLTKENFINATKDVKNINKKNENQQEINEIIISDKTKKIVDLNNQILEKKKENENLNENLNDAIEINTERNKVIFELQSKIDKLNLEKEILINNQLKNIENLSPEAINKLRQKLSNTIAQNTSFTETNLAKITELTNLNTKLNKKKEKYEKKLRQAEKKNVTYSTTIQKKSEKNIELEQEINKKRTENNDKNNENIRLEELIQKKEKENEEINEENKRLVEDNQKINEELVTANNEIEKYKNAVPPAVVAAPISAPTIVSATDTKELEKLLLVQQQQYNDTLQGTLREFMYETQDALQGTMDEYLYKKNYDAEQQKRRESIKILKGSSLKKITESIAKPKKDAKQETRNLSKALAMLGKATSELSDSNRKTKEALAKRKTATSMR